MVLPPDVPERSSQMVRICWMGIGSFVGRYIGSHERGRRKDRAVMFGLAAGGERFVPSFYIDSSMKIGEYCGTKGKMIY